MNKENKERKTQPYHQIRFGTARAAIWKNTTQQGFARLSVTFSKLYIEQESGQWRDSSSFDAKDLPQLLKVVEQTYEFLYSESSKDLTADDQESVAA